jgi:hypothetical protein
MANGNVEVNGNGKMGKLVSEYLAAKEAAAEAGAKLDAAKAALGKAMGEKEETVVSGFKVTYRCRMGIDGDKVKRENRYAYTQCLKEPAFDATAFRKRFPQLVGQFEEPTGKPVLQVGIV